MRTPLGAPFWRLLGSSASSNIADGITLVALPLLLLAAALVLGIARTRPLAGPRPAGRSVRREIAEGVRWLWGHRLLRGLTGIAATVSGLNSLSTALIVLLALDTLRIGEAGFGLLMTASGAGAVLSGLAAPPPASAARRPSSSAA